MATISGLNYGEEKAVNSETMLDYELRVCFVYV